MAVFRWQGVGPQGESVKGEMEAASPAVVMSRLRAQRIRPLQKKIREKGGLEAELKIPGFGESVSSKDVVVFTRQFATMINAGLPIMQALDILAQQAETKTFKGILKQIRHDVENGATLADSMAKHEKIFDDLYTNMVAAGEVGGILDTILERLSIYMEKAMKLKSKIKGAMIYPASIVTVAAGVTAVLLIFVIPIFADMFASFGEALPLPTQIAINMSDFLIKYIVHILILIAAAVFAFRTFYQTERGRYVIDGIVLKLPIFGLIIRKAAVARFTRTLGTLIASGVPLLEAMYITGKTAGNKVVEGVVLSSRQSISEGRTLTEPLAESKVFPPMVCQMIDVGEQTGAVDAMLHKIADFYEEEVDAAVENLTALMEPLVIVFLGVVIGGLVVSMYLPIFSLGAAMMG